MKQSIDDTQNIRIDLGVLDMVRGHRKYTGFPIQRFIEDAIVEKISRLDSDLIKKICGVHGPVHPALSEATQSQKGKK